AHHSFIDAYSHCLDTSTNPPAEGTCQTDHQASSSSSQQSSSCRQQIRKKSPWISASTLRPTGALDVLKLKRGVHDVVPLTALKILDLLLAWHRQVNVHLCHAC